MPVHIFQLFLAKDTAGRPPHAHTHIVKEFY
jgi:hypothetical protein